MATFDPDAYLAQQTFDPDAYLKSAPSNASKSTYGDFARNINKGLKAAAQSTSDQSQLGRGFLDVLDSAALGSAWVRDKLGGDGNYEAVKADIDAINNDYKQAVPDSSGMRLISNIAATAPVGGLFGKIAEGVKAAPAVINALRSSGMSTGAAPVGAMAKAGDLALRTAAAGAVGTAGGAMINPDEALKAGMISAAMPVVFKVVGEAGNGLGNLLFKPNIKNAELAKKAIDEYGIPLGVADISGSSTTKALRSILNDAPFTGGIGARQMEQTQGGFNRAIGRTFGADADKLTPEVLDAAKKKMGVEFDRLWGRNNLVVDDAMIGKMSELDAMASKLPKNEGQSLKAEINDIMSKMADDGSGNLVINGDVANKFQSYLRRRADSSAGLKGELSDLRKTMLDAFKRSVSPEDAAALSSNMGQYKSYMVLEPLLNKGEAGVAGRAAGDVPASLLPSALAQNYSRVAGSPLADLSQIGSQFLVNRVPQTGGSAKAAIQNSAIGAALAYGGLSNPLLAALTIPTAMGANKYLGSPAVAQRFLSSTPNRNRLAELFGESVYRSTPAIAAQ
jgi:hypothetical protein